MKNRIALAVGIFIAVVLLSGAIVSAQEPQPQQGPRPQQPGPPPLGDPLGEVMFPPDMIMQHQRELGLTDEQKTFMRDEIQKTTTRFNELQWQLQDAMEALHETMKANSVNEQRALTQLDKVLDAEREIKRLTIGMDIRIKNHLTPEQQMKLQTMRNVMGQQPGGQRRDRGPGGPDGPGRGPRPGGPGPIGPGPGGPGPGGPGGGGPGGGGPRPGGRPRGPPNS